MKRYIEGDCRTQTIMMPESLDDYVTETNPMRVVDVFVELLAWQVWLHFIETHSDRRPCLPSCDFIIALHLRSPQTKRETHLLLQSSLNFDVM
jgi:hypothetical protein